MRLRALALALLLVLSAIAPAGAQLLGDDTAPGSSCAGLPAGATRVTADADQDGAEVTLVCDGATWNTAAGSELWFESSGAIYYNSGNVGIGTGDPAASLHVAGEAIIGNTSLACAAATAGAIRWSSAAASHEMCDGLAWRSFIASVPSVQLVLTPYFDTDMDVDGSCGQPSCTGTSTVFTLTNAGASTSAVIATGLTNTINFSITSDTCNGNTLGASASCLIEVEPTADGNYPFNGALTVTADNNPIALLQGEATAFGCTPGRSGGGGIYAACGLNDGDGAYDLVVMPNGCDGTTSNPTCAGGAANDNSTTKSWGPTGIQAGVCTSADSSCHSAQNSMTLWSLQQAGVGTFNANAYCQDMVYGGYSNWYLPNFFELKDRLYPAKVSGDLTFDSQAYWTSSVSPSDPGNSASGVNFSTGAGEALTKGVSYRVRCVRRHDIPLPTVYGDSDPDPIAGYGTNAETYPHRLVTESAGTRMSTAIWTLAGFSAPITVSAVGEGTPRVKINGGAETASGQATVGQTVQFVMDAPSTPGTENTATFSIGPDNYQLKAAYANTAITLKMFVTNTATGGNGPAARCAADAAAAGLSGSWNHFAGSGTAMRLSAPWNWGKLERFDGASIADDWEDLWDGSIDNPLNITAAGGTRSGNVWTGTGGDNGKTLGDAAGSIQTCSGWSSASSGLNGYYGNSGNAGAGWLSVNLITSCSTGTPYAYCIQSTAGSDTDPVDVTFGRKVSYVSGARTSSNIVTITGISSTVSVSVSGGSGNPKIKINGGAEVDNGTVGLNGTVQVVMDAPTVLGTEFEALVDIGDDQNVSFKVGYADSSLVKRVFVAGTAVSWSQVGGRSWFDNSCTTMATTAGMGGTWKALLSTSTSPVNGHIGWNWGELQLVDGSKVADDWDDLWDGTIDHVIDLNENGNTVSSAIVMTGSTADGLTALSPGGLAHTFNDWGTLALTANATFGNTAQTASGWVTSAANNPGSGNYYCVEDVAGTTDTTPKAFSFPYAIQVGNNQRITSDPVTISGLGSGVSADVVLTGSNGTPKYTINGGAEQDSGTGADVQNGDVLRLVMTSPNTDNASYLMTVQVGSSAAVPWRTWTGDSSGTAVKRVFVTNTGYLNSTCCGSTFMTIPGADAKCQAEADAAAIGGTWKAILSGDAEVDWAVNRIGYNWSTLKLVDNTTVVTTAGNLWRTETTPLTNAIAKDASGAAVVGVVVWTGSQPTGLSYPAATCNSWAGSGSGRIGSNSSTNSAWLNFSQTSYNQTLRFYCIEQ